MARLQDKIVLITGAAGAVGRAVASAIKREGGQAVTTDLAGQAGIDHALDVTAEDDWQSVLAAVDRRHGRLDGLVNSAGTVHLGTVEETDYATWRRVLAINLDGTFLGCRHALPLLKRSGGAIRLKPPVRCNSIHPAFLEGPMVEDILAQTGRPDVARGQLARDIPLGRLGEPAEVAELCVYLLSDESRFVTGAEFAIDGGLTAR